MKLFVLTLLLSFGTSAEMISIRKYQSPVKSQKDRNTCAYFAVTAMLEGSIKKKFDLEVDISEQFQIYYGKEHFGEYSNSEHGYTYEIALNFRKQYFFVEESELPYQMSFFENGGPCSSYDPLDESAPSTCFSQGPVDVDSLKTVRMSGLEVKMVTNLWSSWKSKTDLYEDEIRDGNGVVATVMVYPPLWDEQNVSLPDETFEKCESGELACYGHAIHFTGYDKEKRIFQFKNSWSKNWGDEGYGYMSYDYVLKHAVDPISFRWDRILSDIGK
ncbi:C1 family peptidase [Halobacteriovorax sp. GB3]|uniref:C1 family peptidase n=1 Tax=Halobacteriovorax sp. GB3 TaxID=2719615 RepID=UPI002361B2EE|nr:C1 family peptidase [Halobacteriovorax sp. GB3]MDD0852773.1 C1 family peptidase [Halobacteriovorax sp. GB3]